MLLARSVCDRNNSLLEPPQRFLCRPASRRLALTEIDCERRLGERTLGIAALFPSAGFFLPPFPLGLSRDFTQQSAWERLVRVPKSEGACRRRGREEAILRGALRCGLCPRSVWRIRAEWVRESLCSWAFDAAAGRSVLCLLSQTASPAGLWKAGCPIQVYEARGQRMPSIPWCDFLQD